MEERKRKYKKIVIFVFLILFFGAVISRTFVIEEKNIDDREVITIAMPYSSDYAGFENSYYVEWLENESGYNIEIEYISETYTTEYLSLLFSSSVSNVDAVFFANNNTPSLEEMEYYIKNEYLLPLDTYISEDSYLLDRIENFEDYDLQKALQYEDGKTYYMPSLTLSETQCYLQTAWINVEWLEDFGLEIPNTTEELKRVLQAFKERDENAVPLIGSIESENTFACNYLMNSFTICDPFNYYFALDDRGELYYPPKSDEWREGLEYCNELYEEGLLVEENFIYNEDELISISNDSSDVVGMFFSKGLSDVIYEDSPQLLSYFLVVPPLNENGSVTLEAQLPEVGGAILNKSVHKEEAFRLLDIMCSEEAYLVGHFGEFEKDWKYSSSSDISVLGYPAEITMIGKDSLERNPSDATVLGPFVTDLYYADRVAWVGYQVNQSEYMQARAYRTYQEYEPKHILNFVAYSDYDVDIENLEALAKYVKGNMIDYIRGVKDVHDEMLWEEYLTGFENYDMDLSI